MAGFDIGSPVAKLGVCSLGTLPIPGVARRAENRR